MNVQFGTITEITATGSVTVNIDAALADVHMLTSDFVSYPRVGQRVVLETWAGHKKARALTYPVSAHVS